MPLDVPLWWEAPEKPELRVVKFAMAMRCCLAASSTSSNSRAQQVDHVVESY